MSGQPCLNPASTSTETSSVEALSKLPHNGQTRAQADSKNIAPERKTSTKLTGGVKRLQSPNAVLPAKRDHPLHGWDESPWKYYNQVFNCDLAGSVSVVTVRTHPSELRAMRMFKREDSRDMLEKFRAIRHENLLLAREYFNHEDSVYVVFDDLPVTLDHVVACDYFPHDAQVSSMLAQILSGLSYLQGCGFTHKSLTCSNILLGIDGTVQIAALDCCVKATPKQSESIDAVTSIATLLMQKYTKSNGSKGIDDLNRWSVDSQAFQFLLHADIAESIDELKDDWKTPKGRAGRTGTVCPYLGAYFLLSPVLALNALGNLYI